MQDNGKNLTRKQEKAIAALLEHPTIKEAAAQSGVAEVTVFRWLQQSTFREAYQKVKREAVSQAIARLQKASSEAVETLRAILADTKSSTGARLSAAKTILQLAIKGVELEDIEIRLTNVEQHIESNQGR